MIPVIAGIAIAIWTAFFVWTQPAGQLGESGSARAASLMIDWSVPVLLVLGVWLLALRYSRRDVVNTRSSRGPRGTDSDAALDGRLAEVSRELGQLRESIASAARDAGTGNATGHAAIAGSVYGDGGTARILHGGDASGADFTGSEDRLAGSIQGVEQRLAELDSLAEQRFEHLRTHAERFRVELETREQDNLAAIRRRGEELSKTLSTQDIAMRTRAGQAMDELQARFRAMRDESLRLSGELEGIQSDALRGWERAVGDLENRMQATVGKVVEVDETAMENVRTRLALLHQEAERVDEAAAVRLQAFEAEIARRRDEAAARSSAALTDLDGHIAMFDRQVDERRSAQLVRISELGERSEALAARMAEIDGQLAGHVEQCEAASNALGSFAKDLSDRLTESRDLLAHSGKSLSEMTDAGARLFEMIRASGEYSAETIPAALSAAQERLATFEERTLRLRDAIVEAESKGVALVEHVERAREGVPVSSDTLDELARRLEEVATQSDALAQRTRHDLRGAIEELETSSQSMADRLRAGQEEALREFAATFGERSLEVVGKGLREKTETAIAELDRAAAGAGRAGMETVDQLSAKLTQLDEMAGNLEARLAGAREKAQDEPGKDFSIEMTKITERLNSAALDITKIFDSDVPDTAWQAYLRGDYGIFTRKAVRLLSSQKADAVLDLYKQDKGLRDTVNRYIADFEAMLRVILVTRNGHSMAVTMLSSDIGKLYVALAQSIDRLRT